MKRSDSDTPGVRWLFPTVAAPLALLILAHGMQPVPGEAQDDREKDRKPPIVLEEHGIFWAGGQIVPRTQPGAEEFETLVGQAYVEYFIPAKKRHGKRTPPIVLIPGGTLIGVHYLTTPDGREGWADFFIRRGYPVYIVDPPGRGRAGFYVDTFNLVREGLVPPSQQPALGIWDSDAWREWNQGPEPRVHGPMDPSCIGNDGRGEPPVTCHGWLMPTGLEEYKHFLAAHVPAGPTPEGGIVPGLTAVMEKVGPAIYIGHSMGGSTGGGIVNDRPELFKALIAVEPAGNCMLGPDVPIAGIAEVPALSIHGINQIGRPNTPECLATYERINAAGGDATYLNLYDLGIYGNGHIMMWEENSDQIAQLLLDWIEEHVAVGKGRGKGKRGGG
jgi:pimeloyl-ACP methyl ester carboxylesterase